MHLRSTAIGPVAGMLLRASAPAAALETVTIRDCYEGDTCRTTAGERIRLACIDTPELRGKRADPIPATAPAITSAELWLEGLSIFAASRRTDMEEPSASCSSMG